MTCLQYAILAVVAATAVPGTQQEPIRTLPEPRQVQFRLADGVRVAGSLTTWDDDGFDGSFGRREWLELRPDDVWRLHRLVMDQESAVQWVNLGRVLLKMSGPRSRPENAFRRALKIDPAVAPAIEAARAEAAEAARARDERARESQKERLETESPEAAPWRAEPWPELDADHRADAVRQMRAHAGRILERAGMQLAAVETDYFLFYSDMPRQKTAQWALELDRMYQRLARIFNLGDDENIFWGKAVIFVFQEQDRFRMVEAEAFGHLAPNWVAGLCHPIGPRVFVNFFRQRDDLDFASILVHETVHGFMHRYRTPRRLPTWANEGFADYLAATTFPGSPIDGDRRQRGVAFIRKGGDVQAILDMSYHDGSWPGPDSVGYQVGYLLVELMIRDRPRKFGDWVNAVKAGKDWEQALEEDFGVPRAQLVERFVQFYKVND